MFQSLPDYWGIDQEFPIMPITHLNKKPTRSASLWDITCDSDGELPFDMKKPLYLHDINLNKEDYFLGFFNVGAYQDTLGMKHNLFSHPTEVNVVFKNDEVILEKIIESQKVIDILEDIDYDTEEMKSILKANLKQDIYKIRKIFK
jgi:arginine decarboxylase